MDQVQTHRETREVQRRGILRRLWQSVRQPLARSRVVKWVLAGIAFAYIKLVLWTNRPVPGSARVTDLPANGPDPYILALWHGQHLMLAGLRPPNRPCVAMVSRSNDAELNAAVLEMGGIATVRGSGGRENDHAAGKGGARALIALKRAMSDGASAAMIADIRKATPREAGIGIVTLARITGAPLLPAAFATSRRKVLERSWDKTTINLPFGRSALVVGDLISVPADADDAMLEARRLELTETLNAITQQAYDMVDGPGRAGDTR